MLKRLFFTRFIVLIIVFVTLINSFAFIGYGVYKSYAGYLGIFKGAAFTAERPFLQIFTSLEYFFIAVVLIVFALGIYQLFILKPSENETAKDMLPKWLRIKSFNELKYILWETIVTTMLVLYLVAYVESADNNAWSLEMLIAPGIVLIIAVTLFILRKGSFELTDKDH